MLKIGVGVAAVSDVASTLKLDYPEVFNGIGKLNSRKITLHIDPDVKPVAQPLRRIPFNLRSKVDDKINELIAHDIIEEVDGPTPWVNPVVIVPKSRGSICPRIETTLSGHTMDRGVAECGSVFLLMENSTQQRLRLSIRLAPATVSLWQYGRRLSLMATSILDLGYNRGAYQSFEFLLARCMIAFSSLAAEVKLRLTNTNKTCFVSRRL